MRGLGCFNAADFEIRLLLTVSIVPCNAVEHEQTHLFDGINRWCRRSNNVGHCKSSQGSGDDLELHLGECVLMWLFVNEGTEDLLRLGLWSGRGLMIWLFEVARALLYRASDPSIATSTGKMDQPKVSSTHSELLERYA